MRWLAEGSAAALAGALREVAPELAGYPVVIPGGAAQSDPRWQASSAFLGDVLWRTDAGIPLADHRTPPDWVDDLAARFRSLGLDP